LLTEYRKKGFSVTRYRIIVFKGIHDTIQARFQRMGTTVFKVRVLQVFTVSDRDGFRIGTVFPHVRFSEFG